MTYDVKQIAIGVSGVNPSILLINTNNTVAEVTATGYLGSSYNYSAVTFTDKQIAMVYTTDGGTGVYKISVDVDGIASLVGPNAGPISGTPNQIDVDDDVVSLSDTVVFPGTAQVGTILMSTNVIKPTTGSLHLEAGVSGSNGDINITNGSDTTGGDINILNRTESGAVGMLGLNAGIVYMTTRRGYMLLHNGDLGYIPIGTDNTVISNKYGRILIGCGPHTSWNVVAGPLDIQLTASSGEIYLFDFKVPKTVDAAQGGVLISDGAKAESFVALDDGQLLVGSSSGVPVAANITTTNGLEVINGANTLEINSKIYRFSVTVSQASLAAAGSATLFAGVVSKQFKILNLWTNFGGTNFSGGGGDRLLSITDNTTAYSVVPAASLQALANTGWGATGLPYPASAAIDTSTASGASLVAKYSGGTTDYTAGSVTISGLLQMV